MGGGLLSNTLLRYHTSEISTGEIWIDGKIIYRKVIPINFSNPVKNVQVNNSVMAAYYPHGLSSVSLILQQRLVWYDSNDGGWFQDIKNSEADYKYFVTVDFIGRINIKILYGPTDYFNSWSRRISKMNLIVEYIKN